MKPVMSMLRRISICTQIYINDLIVCNQSRAEISYKQTHTVLFLLSHLGLDSVGMIRHLPEEKILKLEQKAVWELASLLGKISASIEAVLPATLYSRYCQRLKKSVVEDIWYELPGHSDNQRGVSEARTPPCAHQIGKPDSSDEGLLMVKLLEYCMDQNISLSAEHLPGKLNVEADE